MYVQGDMRYTVHCLTLTLEDVIHTYLVHLKRMVQPRNILVWFSKNVPRWSFMELLSSWGRLSSLRKFPWYPIAVKIGSLTTTTHSQQH